ncbi:helix-turn-helix domain-containing protein [Elizabethkingia anophelis]|uniref:helix-turn-helix domain-containing protein n=1 Tax=Elizabethkingia anophelis TaxID=1117645 RepID=UPI00293C92AD|nr:helix-turn-helix domain-containing protein [Elizabethkingia anophelis]MCT4218036.1 helix-turn-helix domain-containing protein [Elizabethkingia anophelis]MDV3797097.1 DNA-binding protein [Elizabethkingia anophelis]
MENNFIQFSQITVEELGQFIEEKIASAIKKHTITSKSEERPLYTRKETADLLDVSLTTLHNWNKAGILNAKKMGSRVYYSKEDVMALLNS